MASLVLGLSSTYAATCREALVALDDIVQKYASPPPELTPEQRRLQSDLRLLFLRTRHLSPKQSTRRRAGSSPAIRAVREAQARALRAQRAELRKEILPKLERWLDSTGNRFTLKGDEITFPPDPNGGPLNRFAYDVGQRTGAKLALDLAMEVGARVEPASHNRRELISFELATDLVANGHEGHELRHLSFIELMEKGGTSLFQGSINAPDETAVTPRSHYDAHVNTEEIFTHAYSVKDQIEVLSRQPESTRARIAARKQADRAARLSSRISASTGRALAWLDAHPSESLKISPHPLVSGDIPAVEVSVSGETLYMPLPEAKARYEAMNAAHTEYAHLMLDLMIARLSKDRGAAFVVGSYRQLRAQPGPLTEAVFGENEARIESRRGLFGKIRYEIVVPDDGSERHLSIDAESAEKLLRLKAQFAERKRELEDQARQTLRRRFRTLHEVAGAASQRFDAIAAAVRSQRPVSEIQALADRNDAILRQYFEWNPAAADHSGSRP